jgi:hypothetical protein
MVKGAQMKETVNNVARSIIHCSWSIQVFKE